MFKKVYIEITNNCNLKCDFCTLNKREPKFMNLKEFELVLSKLKNYTKYIYFHVLGEPLLHPNINDFIDKASQNFNVNITTNGYLINRVKNNKNIRQLNISLHSFSDRNNVSLEKYLNTIFDAVDILKNNTFIQYRIWTKSKYTKEIIEMINKKYNSDIDYNHIKNNTTIVDNVFISSHDEFNWPRLDNHIYSDEGTCYALRDHIGILVNGDIIPCCLDADAVVRLGNIWENSIEEILHSNRFVAMLDGFKNNKKCEELCKHCDFISK